MKAYSYTKSLILLAMSVIASTFVGCREDFDFDEVHGDKFVNLKKEEYKNVFEEAFCAGSSIDPSHNWGFVDMVSAEEMMSSQTRGSFPNANEWGQYIEVPEPLTQAQMDVVTEWFKSHQNPTGISVDWADYFLQQVSNNSTYAGNMNQLQDVTGHAYNCNNGTISENATVWDGTLTNPNDMNSRVYHKDRIMLVQESSTANFKYHETVSGEWHNKYVIIPGDEIDESVAGMYFLAFDYECYRNNIVNPDGYYWDWILKITPGVHRLTKRVMCEDLGAIGDFDFNDVVFDVSYVSGNRAYVTLLAAGATLPIYIGVKDDAHEVHNLFGVESRTMVNTNTDINGNPIYCKGVVSRPVVSFYVDGLSSTNPIELPIIVENGGTQFALDAANGEAPHKICVPRTVDWTTETVSIDSYYLNFSSWVEDQNNPFWTSGTTNNNEVGNVTPSNPTQDDYSQRVAASKEAACNEIVDLVGDDTSANVLAASKIARDKINAVNSLEEVATLKAEGLAAVQRAKDVNKEMENIEEGALGVKVVESISSGMCIDAKYFGKAKTKVTVTFMGCGSHLNIGYHTSDWSLQGSYNEETNGVVSIVITENLSSLQSCGLNWNLYWGDLPTSIYVKCE